MSAADNGLVSPDLTSFHSIFSSVDFIRAQFIFKPSGFRTSRKLRREHRPEETERYNPGDKFNPVGQF